MILPVYAISIATIILIVLMHSYFEVKNKQKLK